ncbi:MAG: cytochrome c biogenesis protein CcsA [Proteobacteria bacterium]|nr:cytochrome c biogenesis protein CcsA [Pseudomonadota bacterium]
MPEQTIFSLSAIVALVPSSLLPLRKDHSRDMIFWLVLAVAVAGPVNRVLASMAGTWRTDLSTTLWVTVAATMSIFAFITILTRETWRLTPLISAYMAVLGILAAVWSQVPHEPLAAAWGGWIGVHIGVSVTTYALVTIAAVAALAAFLQERALKRKRPTALTRLLPSVADCEWLLVRLLVLGEIVLALGLATGMALQHGETGMLLVLDHKTILTITTFVVIGGLLIAHFKTGLRGRKAARIVLLAYLLLTLGYPGVKFVTDVILA